MEEVENSLEGKIKSVAGKFLKISSKKEIELISHFDTDGISSATIMIQALKKLDRKFSLTILKSLNKEFIMNLPKNKLILFLDLASASFEHIKRAELKDVFIIDHHEVTQEIPENIEIINSELHQKQKISASGLTYLFCKEIDETNKRFAKFAVLGMIGDLLEKELDKLNHEILDDAEIQRKRGLLIYPSTRPINKVLEFCSAPYIPEITGNPKAAHKDIIGDIFLIKLFNKLEDAREVSAKINACSRLGRSDIALQLCMEIPKAKKESELIHARYKQLIISGLKFISESEKISGKGFVIINARDQIRDTMIGTMASILSASALYEEGTIITTMAYYENKIKISARSVGKNGRNLREILDQVVKIVGGEVGGHKFAAGCNILKDKEEEFTTLLRKNLEVELVKI